MKIDIEELKRLAEAATPGPWIIEDLLSGEVVCASTRWPVAATIRHKPKLNSFPQKQKEVNTQYIAAANPAAILALIEQHDAAHFELLATRDDNHSMMLEIHNLRIERDKLLAALELFMDRVDEPPESNCSCHLSPPCNDCVEYSGLREAFSDAHDAIAKAEG